MKNLLLLMLLIFNFSCASYKKKVDHNSDNSTTVEEIEVTEGEVGETEPPVIPVEADKDTLQVKEFINFTREEIDKFWIVVGILDKAVKSQCFEDVFLNQEKLVDTNGKTPAEVVNDLRTKKPVVSFQMYYKNNGTVGYTYSNTNNIWMNKKFHNRMKDCERAGNIGHELSHKRGYGHDYKRTANRPYSVPYTINRAVEKCSCN